MEWLGSEGVAAAVAVFAPWVRLWPVGKPRFLLLLSSLAILLAVFMLFQSLQDAMS